MSAGTRFSSWLDIAAIGTSAACLIHCLMLPLLFAALPALSAIIGLPESIHAIAFLLAVPASVGAMIGGHRRHGSNHPAIMAASGLALMGVGALGGFKLMLETGLTVAGSVTLAVAHLNNWRLRRRPGNQAHSGL